MSNTQSEKMLAVVWLSHTVRTVIIVDTKTSSMVSPVDFEYLLNTTMGGNGMIKYHTFRSKATGYIDCKYPSTALRKELELGTYVKCETVTQVQKLLNEKFTELFDLIDEYTDEE